MKLPPPEASWEIAEDEITTAGGANWALKKNLNKMGSAGACGSVAGVDYAQ